MRTWRVAWIFPVGLTGAVILMSLGGLLGQMLAAVFTLAVVPTVALGILRRSPEGRDRLRELETGYWRSGPR